MFTKLKLCKQTTGPKSVVPGAEMHRTGGKNPTYHVIINDIRPNAIYFGSQQGMVAISKR